MRMIAKSLVAGAALLACAGAAVAAETQTRVMNVALPDGSVARITYQGEVAPRVVVLPGRFAFAPVAFHRDIRAPFAMMDHIAAEMDRRMEAMMRRAAEMSQQAASREGRLNVIAADDMPAGTVRYSFASSSNGGMTCGRSVHIVSRGADQPPEVVTRSFGDCAGNAADSASPAAAAPKAAAPLPDLRETI